MKANELMIGNLVCLGNRIAKVIEIAHLSCVVVDLEETQDTIEDYERTKPIPLTEEWLLKFGFEKNELKTVSYWELYHFKLIKGLKRSGYPFHLVSNVSNVKPVVYIHELQNLHFALTGEELKLKINL